jgi:hypothetical protein
MGCSSGTEDSCAGLHDANGTATVTKIGPSADGSMRTWVKFTYTTAAGEPSDYVMVSTCPPDAVTQAGIKVGDKLPAERHAGFECEPKANLTGIPGCESL